MEGAAASLFAQSVSTEQGCMTPIQAPPQTCWPGMVQDAPEVQSDALQQGPLEVPAPS
jgi:hypothetical protein